jgi:hypothetical protein
MIDGLVDDAGPRRARTLRELSERLGRLFLPEEAVSSIQSYRARPTDIIISPYGESGTTWLQQMFHMLRTGGDMGFDDVCRVVPWIETAVALGIDLEGAQPAKPRGFKSHMMWEQIPKGARYVVSLRNPMDSLVSRYRHYEGWLLEPGTVPLTDFVLAQMRVALKRPHEIWHHLVSWWRQRDNPNVLLVSYESIIDDPAAFVRDLARFCGIPLDDHLLELTLERSSLAFMRRHKDRFDDRMLRELSIARCNLPSDSDAAKVRTGMVGAGAKLPPEYVASFDEVWRRLVSPHLSFPTYGSLEADLRRFRSARR